MIKKQVIYSFMAILCLIFQKVYAQDAVLSSSKLKIGGSIGYGIPVAYEPTGRGDRSRRLKYEYWPLLFQLELQKHWKLRNEKWYLGYLIQPQLNLAEFKHHSLNRQSIKAIEMGVNANIILGVLLHKNPAKRSFSAYTFLGSGPHFLSASPKRQSAGFTFSDNFGFGVQIGSNYTYLLDFRIGIRHLSNASIKRPNAGINNLIFNIGVKIPYK